MFSGVILCILMGVGGYLAFMDATSDNIIYDFKSEEFWSLATIFKLLIVVHMCVYMPIDFSLMKESMLKLYYEDEREISEWFNIISSIITLMTALAIAAVLLETTEKAFGLVMSLTGGICGSIIVFILPGIFSFISFSSPSKQIVQEPEPQILHPAVYDNYILAASVFSVIIGISVFVLTLYEVISNPSL